MNEYQLINKYFRKLSLNNIPAKKLNDDVFFDKSNKLVISVDAYNEGVHFPNFNHPDLVAKKVIRSSISDLISKGVKPKYYFISGSGNKKKFTKKNLKKLSSSLMQEQNRFNIKLSGGDTTFSNKVNFTVTVVGFSNKIIERNKARLNDDIYITGNIGDSYLGLRLIKGKIRLSPKKKKYFVSKYYIPEIPFKIFKNINKFANTSMDVSDGLFSDMTKLINKQNLNYEIYLNQVPISSQLNLYLKKNKLNKLNYIHFGDDYQILFTASPKNRKLIKSIASKINQKITIIGKILSGKKRNVIKIDNKSLNISDFKGYNHSF